VSQAPGVGGSTWSWVVVHQAIGMAMEELACSGLVAFLALVRRAEATGQTVSDLSRDVVERRFRFRAIKRAADRPKDRETLPALEEALCRRDGES
jgi:hypothetical protein